MKHPKRRNKLAVVQQHQWWTYRPRIAAWVNGEMRVVQRAIRLAPVDSDHPNRRSVMHLAEAEAAKLGPTQATTRSAMRTGEIKMKEFVESIYLPLVKQKKRPSTYFGYRQMWVEYLEPLCGGYWLTDVRTGDVINWLDKIATDHGLCKTTLRHIKHLLSGFFTTAIGLEYLKTGNPVTKFVEVPAFAPEPEDTHAYSLEEVFEMMSRVPELASTAIAVAAFAGLTRAELRGLRWEDSYERPADAESLGLLHVKRDVWRKYVGEPKTKKRKGVVPVIPPLAQKLDAYRKGLGSPASGPIFATSTNTPLSLDALAYRDIRPALDLCAVCRKCRREHEKNLDHAFKRDEGAVQWRGWHGFRRGLATNLNRLGVDDSVIQGVMRHSTVAVTQACYIKPTDNDRLTAMRKFSDTVSQLFRSPLVLETAPEPVQGQGGSSAVN
jgi:integrase